MRPPPIFLAATVLVATLVLALFGVSALSPTDDADADVGTIYATPLETPTVGFGNPVRGATAAKVTIVEFGDFQCEPCAALEESLARLVAEYPESLRVVWKDFPNVQTHPEAVNAAVAARCAERQGAFWQYHDLLLSRQGDIGPGAYGGFAAELGLDAQEFATCADAKDTEPLIERDFEEGQRLRIDGTPYLFINGQRVSGGLSYEQLKAYVAAELGK